MLPSLTALENVVLPLQILGETAEIEVRARKALALFGLDTLGNRIPSDMSGGQIQRTAIARAIVTRPRIIIADEPTGQLDTATAQATVQSLLSVASEFGAAVVIATHDATIAAQMNDVWSMSYGGLVVPGRGKAA